MTDDMSPQEIIESLREEMCEMELDLDSAEEEVECLRDHIDMLAKILREAYHVIADAVVNETPPQDVRKLLDDIDAAINGEEAVRNARTEAEP